MAIVTKKRQRDPSTEWFRHARFGMFVHFGLYALLGRNEWVMLRDDIPRSEYEQLASQFNPAQFDANDWIDMAEKAGARYMTVTAKHHDGFCLFDSKHTDFKITNTPFGRDLIGELIGACQRRHMRIILYYSQPDWHHPDYVHKPGAFKDLPHPPATDEPDWPRFQEYLKNQVLELVSEYGRIDGIWFDGSHKSEQEFMGRRMYRLIKEHQPGAVVNDRARYGDFWTPERWLPDDELGEWFFEACDSVATRSWGYAEDSPLFNAPHLIESLVRTAANGGNYLLNVSPKADGTIPVDQARRMEAVGEWLQRHGEAIYGTEGCRLASDRDGVLATRNSECIYLHLPRWPAENRLALSAIRSKPSRAELLGSRRSLRWQMTENGLELRDLPASPLDDNVSTIRLRFPDPPVLRLAKPAPSSAKATVVRCDRTSRLKPEDALLSGYGINCRRIGLRELANGKLCLHEWDDLGQVASWRIYCPKGGRFGVSVLMSCPAPYAGSEFVVEAKGGRLRGKVKTTPSFDSFSVQNLGTLLLPKGRSRICLRPTKLPYGYIFADIQEVVVKPAVDRAGQIDHC